MVQIIDLSPTESNASLLGKAVGSGLAKRMGIGEAENAFQQAQGDPFKLATAMAKLMSVSPELERAAGPMYQAILGQTQAKELAAGARGREDPSQFIPKEQVQGGQPGQAGNAPSVTEYEPQEATRKPYIPREYGQIVQDAERKYPKLFSRDPEKAINQENAAEQQNLARSSALQAQRQKQSDIENTLKSKLKEEITTLGITPGTGIAGNLFSNIEDKAINSVKPIAEGGEGLTEQQAAKKYGKEIESAGRDYNVIKGWGGTYTMGPWNAKNVRNQIESVKQNFKERNDLENFADLLVGENGVSPMTSRYLTYDVGDVPGLAQEINRIPNLKDPKYLSPSSDEIEKQTLKIAPNLAKKMGKDGSPLAIGQYLSSKGYDVNTWLDYLNKNRKPLDLSERQGRELGLTRSVIPNLNDIWMMIVDDKSKNL